MKTLRHISKMIFALAALAWLAPTSSFACAVCAGRSDSSLATGMNWGIFTLMGVIVTMLATVAGFFIYLVHRQNAFAKAAEQMAEQNLSEAKV
jgi:heme/copper-type cytochrome/quinol oxidase subunit 2